GYPANAPNSECRVPALSTVVWHKADPENLMVAVFDHILNRTDATFDEFVQVENFLIDSDAKWASQAGLKQGSGLHQFKRLQHLSRALDAQGNSSEDSPLIQ